MKYSTQYFPEINVLVRKIYTLKKAYFETPTTLPGSKRFSLSETAKNAACGPPYPKKSRLLVAVCCNIYLSHRENNMQKQPPEVFYKKRCSLRISQNSRKTHVQESLF